ncbi:MAG: hypothetical protein K2J39_05400 [Ruminococcus sp.]|nr:hypothetical protein [Ruminococcus sp.]
MKKFAVYKSETGFYYYRYFDSMEQLAGNPLENIVTPDKLPIVADDKGGFFCFDPEDFNFSEITETDSDYPLELEKMFFRNDKNFRLGWISPDGDTYSCDYTGHQKCAFMIARKFFPYSEYPERTLGRAGWLKVIDSWNGTQREHGQFIYSMTGKITESQINTLFDLGLYNNPEVQELIDCT